MRTTERGVRFIAQREACVLVAYQDGTGHSIGFGRFGVEPDMILIDASQALKMLRHDIEEREPQLEKMLSFHVLPHTWDACISLGYNAGMGALRRSEVIRLLNAGDYPEAGDAFTLIKSHTPGLMKRRLAERAIFLDADYGDLTAFKLWRDDPRATQPETVNFPPEEEGQ
jgi:lysozyme